VSVGGASGIAVTAGVGSGIAVTVGAGSKLRFEPGFTFGLELGLRFLTGLGLLPGFGFEAAGLAFPVYCAVTVI